MKKISSVVLLLIAFLGYAQQNSKQVLFTIDKTPFYTDEFLRVYQKNLDLVKDESQKDLNNYLDLFLAYKLKIQKAYKLNLHQDLKHVNELKSYKDQLSKKYLTDTKVTDELIAEALERSKFEIKASHILIQFPEGDKNDTIEAYKKIADIRQQILKGADFNKLASTLSEDPSARENKGNLGYFSAFRMIYPFETAAYKTPVGEVSEIIKTQFGYHILFIHDKRPSRGDVTVAHIMLSSFGDEEKFKQNESKINDIYQKLLQGEDFAALASQFSDDKNTAIRGGAMDRISSGDISSIEFEDVAFSTNENEFSKPFRTAYGWHIVKVLQKHPSKSIDEQKTDIANKIERDERSRLISESFNNHLRKKFKHSLDNANYQRIFKTLTDSVYVGSWQKPENAKPFSGKFLTIEKKVINGETFLSFLEQNQKNRDQTKPLSAWLKNQYNSFLNNQLNEYNLDNLENEFEDFAHVMQEYKEGLLLFDLMEKEIWDKAKNDSIGLQKIFNLHKDKYVWNTRYNVQVFSSVNKNQVEQAKKMLQAKKTIQEIKEALNTEDKLNIMVNEGLYEKDHGVFPKSYDFTAGISEVIEQNNYFFLINLIETLPQSPKTFEEAKGRVINEYQQILETNWVGELKKEFKVDLNNAVFETVKNQLK